MVALLMQFKAHPFSWFFLELIPWWAYVVSSVALAIVIITELPTRVGLAIGLMAAIALGSIGFQAKGFEMGVAQDSAMWSAKATAEQDRLKDGFQKALAEEMERGDIAREQFAQLKREQDDAIHEAGPGGGGIVIPSAVAAKLYLIGRSRKPWSPFGSAKHTGGAPSLPRVLLPSRQVPGPSERLHDGPSGDHIGQDPDGRATQANVWQGPGGLGNGYP